MELFTNDDRKSPEKTNILFLEVIKMVKKISSDWFSIAYLSTEIVMSEHLPFG